MENLAGPFAVQFNVIHAPGTTKNTSFVLMVTSIIRWKLLNFLGMATCKNLRTFKSSLVLQENVAFTAPSADIRFIFLQLGLFRRHVHGLIKIG